ncbi:MAG: hypothetical protein ACRCXD_09850 [Luteolibacter sp.]
MRKPFFPSKLLEDLEDSDVLPRIDDTKPQNTDSDALPDGSRPANPSMADRDLAPEDGGKDAGSKAPSESALKSLQAAEAALKMTQGLFERALEDGKDLPSGVVQALTEMTEGLKAGVDAMGGILEEVGGASAAEDQPAGPSTEQSNTSDIVRPTDGASAARPESAGAPGQNLGAAEGSA